MIDRKTVFEIHRFKNAGYSARQIAGGFSYIPHRFLTGGSLASLEQKEILLYLFLILVCR